ncbi:hypothetical protein [Clostridium sp. Cult2]|uniref:hypothetical protein n=1 Tax=Clostridium sp. Cult2 TaxID=2079003 RepID=UPI001F438282|nr:hypothetical protein [Clostridium sp. Cult2]MCF6464431.1 hypothetical protein [Clostridium sp. Cult2]
MFKERVKTFLLLSLVFISVFLTRRLWIQMPYEILPIFQKEEALSANYLLTDMIKPDKYLLNFDEKNHTIFHNDDNNNLWTSARSSLADILSSNNIKTEILSTEEFLTYHKKKSIVFYFPEKFSTYILARSLDVVKPNNITEKMTNIDNIYFYLGREEPYVVFSDGNEHLKVYDLNIDLGNVKNKLKIIEEKDYTFYYPIRETLNIDSDIYITYRMSKNMPLVYVENELDIDDIEEVRSIAEMFFKKNIDYIREIVENNGSILYVYNQKVLKINRDGLLEYFSPLEEPVKERNLYISLNTASEFLSSYMGVPKDLYLSKIEEIESEQNLGYKLTFNYRIRGIPIVLGKDIVEDFIQIDVFNEHIRNYKRFIRRDMNIKVQDMAEASQMFSAFDIINANYQLLEKGYIQDNKVVIEDIKSEELREEILSSIIDISLAYLDPCLNKNKEELVAVWLLKIGDRTYAFDVYSGNLVLSRKQ